MSQGRRLPPKLQQPQLPLCAAAGAAQAVWAPRGSSPAERQPRNTAAGAGACMARARLEISGLGAGALSAGGLRTAVVDRVRVISTGDIVARFGVAVLMPAMGLPICTVVWAAVAGISWRLPPLPGPTVMEPPGTRGPGVVRYLGGGEPCGGRATPTPSRLSEATVVSVPTGRAAPTLDATPGWGKGAASRALVLHGATSRTGAAAAGGGLTGR